MTINEAFLLALDKQKYIYGFMYGSPYINTSTGKVKDDIIKIKQSDLKIGKNKDCFIYIWGWPGPDANFYKFKDYGITWSFNKEDLE